VTPKAAPRLSLRPLSSADAPELLEAIEVSRAELKRRFRWPSSVVSPEQCAEFVAAAVEREKKGQELVRGAFAAKDGKLVGIGALQRLDAEPGVGEMSLWVRTDRNGKNFAQDIGRALIETAFKGRVLRLYTRLDPTNRAGRQVLKKLKFKYEGRLRRDKRLNGRGVDQECWGLLKEDL
jgi:RimJ/RimL family protein N-acetyltransferase